MLLEERLRSVKQACSRTSKTPALIVYARGAPPLMRERRINRAYDALWIGSVASTYMLQLQNIFRIDNIPWMW